jgi:hypothetical protein
LTNATGTPEPIEQPRRFGEGQLTRVQAEDVAVEERESSVRLFQGVEWVLLGLGDVVEETADGAEVEVTGVALVVEEDEAACPVGVALGGAILAKAVEGDMADKVEQSWRLGRRGAGESLSAHGLHLTGKRCCRVVYTRT